MINEITITDFIKNTPPTDQFVLVDLRNKLTYSFGSIPGAINIPIDNLPDLYALPQDKTIYLFCQTGEFSQEIAELLAEAGYQVYNIIGGYREYLRS